MSDERLPPVSFAEAQKRLNLSRYLTRRAIELGLLDVQFKVGRTEMISEASVGRLLGGGDKRADNDDPSAAA
jgi:hypothetical protein